MNSRVKKTSLKRLWNTTVGSAIMLFLGLTMIFSLPSCKDAPCQTAARCEMDISQKLESVKKMGFFDYFLASSDVKEKCSELRVSVEEYRSHLSECTNSNCKKQAEERIPALDKVISEMEASEAGADICKILLLIFSALCL